jgi:hypothetical protein
MPRVKGDETPIKSEYIERIQTELLFHAKDENFKLENVRFVTSSGKVVRRAKLVDNELR